MSLRTAPELLRELRSGRRMLADGAIGSELLKAEIDLTRTVEANLLKPHRVEFLHKQAIAAGAELITTNTFGMPYRAEDPDWSAAFQAGIEIADFVVSAAVPQVTVMLSVYPDELLQHPEIVLAPFQSPATRQWLLLIETAIDLQEACVAAAMARQSGVETIAATCHFRRDGLMPDGSTPAQAVSALHAAGASIVGANCGDVPEAMVTVAEQMRAVTDLPLLFQPNAGLPQNTAAGWIYPVDAERFAANAANLLEAGASIVGGCCGTTPVHIAATDLLLFHPQRRE